ncbi:MAG: beta galactosidase jelly roll domain-containing protein [Thermoleophilaceae bacterium]|nr:beta galactosidase jelly roll domain-containing protein [Thermoleophilaceae bacterium]
MRASRVHAALACAAALAAAPAAHAAPPPVPAERALYEDGPSGRYLLERGWTTRADPRDVGLRAGWQRPGRAAGFRPVSIPNAFNARRLDARGNRSRVQWYRVRFSLPPTRRAAAWRLRFESVSVRADVWLNGRRLGSHVGAYLPFELPARGIRPGANELVVRVDGRESRLDIPPAGRPRGWWNYGGILREVYLRRAGPLDLDTPRVTAAPGRPVRFSATIRNTTRSPLPRQALLELTGPGGFAREVRLEPGGVVRAGEAARISGRFEIANAVPWSPARPALYVLRVRLPGGQVTTIHFGVREWSRDSRGRALLNGRPVSLRGASFHEEVPGRGGALTAADEDAIAADLAALGANAARQHYPPSPRLLEAFDRLGIVFWEQLPVWRMRGAQLRDRRVRAAAESRLREAILRDRNHASVMTWSVGDEILRADPAEERYIRECRRLADRLDGTRFLGIDASISPVERIPRYYRLLDAVGLSDYLGWYGGTSVDQLRPALDEVRARLAGVALLVSEFGAEANRRGPAREPGTYAFQSSFLDRTLTVLERTPYVNGWIVWLLRDYAVRPGWSGGNPKPSPPLSKKGLIDDRGVRKPAWEVVRRHFEAQPPPG